MVRQDILAGLRNALERGEILGEAKASLINAGYSREEVEEAAATLSKIEEMTEIEEVAPVPKAAAGAIVEKKKKIKKLLPYLIIVAAVIIIAASAYFFLMKE